MTDISKERCEEVAQQLRTANHEELIGYAADRAADLITALRERVEEVETRLRKAAQPDCPDCNGSGLYGEDCICFCVNAKHGAKDDK